MTNRLFKAVLVAGLTLRAGGTVLQAQTVATSVDSVRHEVVISASPFNVPPVDMHDMMPGMDHGAMGHDGPIKLYQFEWPVDAYGKAFRVEVRDSRGALLPRSLLHHVIGINLDRRQFIYAAAERLFAIGKETENVTLPGALAVPLEQGQRLGFYVAWHNDTGRELKNVSVRIVMTWVPASAARQLIAVLPVYLDVNNDIGGDNTFDVAPGKSFRTFEFSSPVSGKLLGVGGHLHDYGIAMRLDDAVTGATLVRLPAERDKDGRITSMPRKFFAFNPVKLAAGHRYRVVAEYDSPKSETVKGVMGNLVAAIVPNDPSQWPAIDPNDASFQKDIRSLGLSAWTPGAQTSRDGNGSRR